MKRKIALVIVFALLSTGIVFAASVNGMFAGLPIVNVKVNGEAVKSDVPGVVLQGKTLLPARAIAESLDSVVSWDQTTMTASITKPEISMSFVNEVQENSDGTWDLKGPYGILPTGVNDVIVYYEIGPMAKQQYEYRIALTDPKGDFIALQPDSSEIDSKGIIGYSTFYSVQFKQTGNYIFSFQIKYDNEFKTVGRKTLIVE